jgi:site-specific recombinase XerD
MTEQGRRDHAILLFLYITGARASEAAAVTIHDLDVRSDGSCRGRGYQHDPRVASRSSMPILTTSESGSDGWQCQP